MQARRQRGCSSRRPFDPGLSSLASRHHSTAPPHPKRYDKRYEDKFLENIRLHRRPTKTLWWPRGRRGGTSHGPYPVDISSEVAPTTRKVGTTKERAVPRRRRKKQRRNSDYFSWSNLGVLIGRRNGPDTKATAPAQ